jgi:NAD-dependent dihydropyrimidine dehydrogenase PreA subunit
MKKNDPSEIFARVEARVAQEKMPAEQIYYDLAEKLNPGEKLITPRILARAANLDQARILAALPDPEIKPASGRSLEISDSFAARLNLDKSLVEKHIREMYEKGFVFPTKKGPSLARNFMQLHDAALGNPKYDEQLGKIYFDLWGMMDGPMVDPLPSHILPGQFVFRIIPRWPSIKDVRGIQPWEDARTILKSQELIALIPCGCKRSHTDRWCGVPEESCLSLGRTAQYNLDRGTGRKLSYDEAVGIIESFDKLPVIHATVNQREVTQLFCNCHHCCCPAFRFMQKSRFMVKIEPEKCNGCRACAEKCQFQAISMGTYGSMKGQRACVDPEVCRGCGSCVIVCKPGAMTMAIVRPLEHVPESLTIY